MQKLLQALLVLLVVSLVANVALVVRLSAPRVFPAQATPAAPAGAAASTANGVSGGTTGLGGDSAIPTAAGLAALQSKLLVLGIAPDTTREILRAMLLKPLHDRRRAIFAETDAPLPYWQQAPAPSVDPANPTDDSGRHLTPGQRAELRALADQIEAVASEILGPGALAVRDAGLYAFLPVDKATALAPIDRDYALIRDDLKAESSIFPVAFDASLRKLIADEYRRDLESTLGPQELADYDLRYSPAALDLRRRFAALPDSTEAEYRAAHALAQTIAGADGNPDARAAAQQQLRDLLGAERHAVFQRAGDPDYISLQNAATRFNLPTDTINRVYDLRAGAASLSQQVAADNTLAPEDKIDALRAIAEQVRVDVRASLGDDIADAYLKKNMRWLDTLSEGEPLDADAK